MQKDVRTLLTSAVARLAGGVHEQRVLKLGLSSVCPREALTHGLQLAEPTMVIAQVSRTPRHHLLASTRSLEARAWPSMAIAMTPSTLGVLADPLPLCSVEFACSCQGQTQSPESRIKHAVRNGGDPSAGICEALECVDN